MFGQNDGHPRWRKCINDRCYWDTSSFIWTRWAVRWKTCHSEALHGAGHEGQLWAPHSNAIWMAAVIHFLLALGFQVQNVKKSSYFPSLILKQNLSKAFKSPSKLKPTGTVDKKISFLIYIFIASYVILNKVKVTLSISNHIQYYWNTESRHW